MQVDARNDDCQCCIHKTISVPPRSKSTKLLVARGRLDGLDVNVMFDTGASTSHLSTHMQRRLQLKLENEVEAPKVTTATGDPISCSGVISTDLELFLENQGTLLVQHSFTVCDINVDCVLGLDFMRKYKAHFGFTEDFPTVTLHHTTKNKSFCVKTNWLQTKGTIHMLNQVEELYLIHVNDPSTPKLSTVEEKDGRVTTLVKEFQDVFTPITSTPPPRDFKHSITVAPGSDLPKKRAPYRMSPSELDELRAQLDDMLKKGFIVPSSSEYGARVLFVKKKDGKLRMVVDYRELNKSILRNSTALPRIEDVYAQLTHGRVFTKLDLESGYYQIELEESSRKYTALATYHGLFEYTVLPMGITNAVETFMDFMRRVLRPLLNRCAVVYLDDILIYSKDEQEHHQDLRKVFKLLQENGLHLKQSKCMFYTDKITFLGNVVHNGMVSPDAGKVAAIHSLTPPKSTKQLQSFLGLVGYYNRYIDNFSKIAAPLTDRLKTKPSTQPFSPLTKTELESFDALKLSITSDAVLQLPDFEKKFYVFVDASDVALGGCLTQKEDGGRKYLPVAFCSKKWTPTQSRYHTYDKELTALVYTATYWKHYLAGQFFTVFSDCQALTHVPKQVTISNRLARQLHKLSEFNFEIVHIQGTRNRVADGLSRLPSDVFTNPSTHLVTSETEDNDEPYQMNIIHARQNKQPQQKPIPKKDKVVVLDKAKQLDIIYQNHDANSAIHPGIHKTLDAIARSYWWPGLKSHVKEYIKTCDSCQRNKEMPQKPQGLLKTIETAPKPFHTLTMDFLGPLPKSGSFDFLLVVVDKFSKYTILIPTLQTVTAAGVATLLLRHVIAHHGLFRKVISDRDVRFTASTMKEISKLLGIDWKYSSSHHPETDGNTEIVNKHVTTCLRHLVSKQQQNWATYIPLVQLAINSRVHGTTRLSPFYIVHGRHADINNLTRDNSTTTTNEMARRLIHNIREATAMAVKNIVKAQEKQKTQADKKRLDTLHLEVGDWALLSTKHLRPKVTHKKLAPKYIGPFKVKRSNHPTYELNLPTTLRIHPTFHVSLLKHYFLRDGLEEPPVQLMDVEDEIPKGHYEIERVLGVKGRQALVKWKGYPPEESSWVLLKDLRADELLEDYYNSKA